MPVSQHCAQATPELVNSLSEEVHPLFRLVLQPQVVHQLVLRCVRVVINDLSKPPGICRRAVGTSLKDEGLLGGMHVGAVMTACMAAQS